MNSIAELEALNPVPEPRGNPGPYRESRRQRRRRKMPAALVAAAAAVIAIGAFVVDARMSEPVEVEVVSRPEQTPPSAKPDTTPSTATLTHLQPSGEPSTTAHGPANGIARLVIPAIDVDQIVVDDVSVAALRKGPGHYPSTPLPGQAGNAAIAGHRTTYGAPFYRLNDLVAGDSIIVTTAQGRFEYKVDNQQIVAPNDLSVLDDVGGNRLTLTTPHPRYSAAQQLVVVASLSGEPAPTIAPDLLSLLVLNQRDDAGIPDIRDESFKLRTQPYFSFEGDADVLSTANAFVDSQFGDWSDGVELVIAGQTERAAAVRWSDLAHGSGGWITVFFSDGRNHVWEMTMDGVHAPMFGSQTGGRGVAHADRSLQLEVLRPVRFSLSTDSDGFSDLPLSVEPLVVHRLEESQSETIVTFEIERREHFQEVRTIVRNDEGEQVGGIASSLALPALNELAVVTIVADSDVTRAVLASSPEVIAGPQNWDRWQSIARIAGLAPEFLPAEVGETPSRELTTFALRPISTPSEFTAQIELLQVLDEAGVVVSLPDPVAEPQPQPELPPRSMLYRVDELPSVDVCRHLQASGWARPEIRVIAERQVFATPEEARDSVRQTATGHVVEFRIGDGAVVGFARATEFNAWRFSSLAVVEQVDGGWVLDRWERSTC